MKTQTFDRIVSTIIAVTVVLTGALPAAAQSAADRCEVSKNKTAGKYASCRQGAYAKSITTGDPVVFSRCDSSLTKKWTKAEDVSHGDCPTLGDEEDIQSCVAAHSTKVALALSGGGCATLPATGQTQCDTSGTMGTCPGVPAGQDGELLPAVQRSAGTFTDNGDGTVSDLVTGLMWEKLTNDPFNAIHDVDDTYTWPLAFAGKIAALNAGSGFAGRIDWKMPSVTELLTIVNYGAEQPAAFAAFDSSCVDPCTACSCAQSDNYWSSTTKQGTPGDAWLVSFDQSDVFGSAKTTGYPARAVRGGA